MLFFKQDILTVNPLKMGGLLMHVAIAVAAGAVIGMLVNIFVG